MNNSTSRNLKLGLFTMAGMAFIVLMLYMIGSSRNMFSSNFEISARFRNVNGLMIGNNVRLSGIDVGTVKKIDFINDTSVQVVMVIEKKIRKFIKKNSLASVGTDGLIGSKLININTLDSSSPSVESGDVLNSIRPIEGDEMLRTLNTTNQNLYIITEDLKKITKKLNNNNSLWSILRDTVVAQNLKDAVMNAKLATKNISRGTLDLQQMIGSAQKGEGLLGVLLKDTTLSNKLRTTVENVNQAGGKIKAAGDELKKLSEKINSKGAVNMLLTDSSFREQVRGSILNINEGTKRFSEDMEALKHNFLLRGYFKKLEKEKQKEKKRAQ